MVSDILLAADVNITEMDECRKKYAAGEISLSDGMMCAGVSDGAKDACQV